MTAAIIGLVGVLLGALMTQIGAAVNDRRQTRHEAARWRRDQLAAAYDGAIRYLLRMVNRRSEFFIESGRLQTLLAKEHVREWFDDLVEAQFMLRILLSRCSAAQADRISTIVDTLDGFISSLESPSAAGKPRSMDISFVRNAVTTVTQCASEEVGSTAGNRMNRRAE